MGSKGSQAWDLNQMSPGRAVSTARIDCLYRTSDGMVLGVTNITAVAALSAQRVAIGETFAPGCMIICVNSAAAATVALYTNVQDDVTPLITGYFGA